MDNNVLPAARIADVVALSAVRLRQVCRELDAAASALRRPADGLRATFGFHPLIDEAERMLAHLADVAGILRSERTTP
jgi:alkanesulfonate monooxygenase SsuD/methylene tetrahydromethanopterin reductase-like flavin-dependent oxidoreductase (luciferase family)